MKPEKIKEEIKKVEKKIKEMQEKEKEILEDEIKFLKGILRRLKLIKKERCLDIDTSDMVFYSIKDIEKRINELKEKVRNEN